MPERQCTAHKRNGERCKNAALRGGTVCGYHGGKAKQVREKAQRRLAEAADQMARRIIGFALDNGIPENIALAAAKDVLDRAGLSAKFSMAIELSAKFFELVFDSISAGPRNTPTPALAIEDGIVDHDTDKLASEADDDEIVGEFDDDEIDEDLPRIPRELDSGYTDVIDVGIMSESPGTTYPRSRSNRPQR